LGPKRTHLAAGRGFVLNMVGNGLAAQNTLAAHSLRLAQTPSADASNYLNQRRKKT